MRDLSLDDTDGLKAPILDHIKRGNGRPAIGGEGAIRRGKMWVWLSVAFVPLLYAAAIYGAWKAIATARTPQGSVGWVVFLLSLPVLALPLFLFLGQSRYSGYVVARTASGRVVDGLNRFAADHAPTRAPSQAGRAMEYLAKMPLVRGNDLQLLVDGRAGFDAIFEAFDSAEEYILAQSYIIRDDEIGREYAARLAAAAGRGVRVHLLFDAVGCNRLPRRYISDLEAAGVHVANPGAVRGPGSRFQINFRNHRKTVVVDGAVGFNGGLNIGNEYLGLDPKFGPWRDTHARMTGPIVSQLQLVFLEDWHYATQGLLDGLNWNPVQTEADMDALVMATGPSDEKETGALFFFTAIAAAQDRLWIASPYFVPDIDVLSALKHAALRGVDVRIILPDNIDHRIVWLAAFAYFDEVMAAGVQIWRYTEGFMHQKVVLVDDEIAAVGTTNLDNRSFRLNFESMSVFFDVRAARQVATMLDADLDRSYRLQKRLSQQSRSIRVGAPIARLFAPLL